MEKNKTGVAKFAVPVVALIVGAVIGFMINSSQSNTKIAHLSTQIDTVKKQFPGRPDIRMFPGVIKSIDGNVITIESLLNAAPFEDLPKERVVTVAPTTKIIQLEVGKASPTFTEKDISLSSLKVGLIISVAAGENIKEKISFVATKITLPPVAPVPQKNTAVPAKG